MYPGESQPLLMAMPSSPVAKKQFSIRTSFEESGSTLHDICISTQRAHPCTTATVPPVRVRSNGLALGVVAHRVQDGQVVHVNVLRRVGMHRPAPSMSALAELAQHVLAHQNGELRSVRLLISMFDEYKNWASACMSEHSRKACRPRCRTRLDEVSASEIERRIPPHKALSIDCAVGAGDNNVREIFACMGR